MGELAVSFRCFRECTHLKGMRIPRHHQDDDEFILRCGNPADLNLHLPPRWHLGLEGRSKVYRFAKWFDGLEKI